MGIYCRPCLDLETSNLPLSDLEAAGELYEELFDE